MFRFMLGVQMLALTGGLFAASPPALIHYQGVLRGAADEPLGGTYDMVFRFFDSETGGNELLVDAHLASGGQAVVVSGGLFSVGLGSGALSDGSGPGTVTSLADLFRDQQAVWLEVQIGAETLAPRTRVLASGYALSAATAETAATSVTSANAAALGGQPPSHFLDTSGSWQWKYGALVLQNSEPGHAALDAVQTGTGGETAGYFASNAFTGRAWLAEGHRGMRASGDEFGGLFESPYWGSSVYAARDNTGLWSNSGWRQGSCAGRFYGAFDGASHAAVLGCTGGVGVDGYGNPGGHFLSNWGWTGEAFLGYGDEGVHGYGTFVGGYFVDTDSSSWVRTAFSTYKVQGSGTVSFVQNHPSDKGKVIVYAAPEGDEVAVYTRGTAKLSGGEARVKLGETFALVANPDLGLTANVTPLGDPIPLAVVERSTSEIVVRGPAGSDAAFDYIVWGLRIGFESLSVVQPKSVEAPVPSMAEHEAVYAADPSLRGYSALERYKAMEPGRSWDDAGNLSRSRQLLDAVGVYDTQSAGSVASLLGLAVSAPPASGPDDAAPPSIRHVHPSAAPEPSAAPADRDADAVRAPRDRWLTPLPVSARIESGDVVVLDPLAPGAVRPCGMTADRHLVGVAVGADHDGIVDVAVAAVVEVRADATLGAIAPGDLLTTSATPGAAMRASGSAAGTILGKALEPLEAGVGMIRVLLSPR